ncbi:MAG TPA: hypoxanthine phosphoribosyltransferase [Anaerolineales bacterium]|nr:hypoxanthine phosphoribosyltransferase [Anaerolineales bacterium]
MKRVAANTTKCRVAHASNRSAIFCKNRQFIRIFTATIMQHYSEILSEVLISEEQLQARIAQLAQQLDADYATHPDLLLVCILRGGVMFLTDLMRKMTVPHQIDFMSIGSYGSGARSSTGNVRVILDLQTDIRGRHVVLVEDIVDSGHTLARVLELLNSRQPASLKVCCLLDKESRRQTPVPIDYVGFPIEDKFVFGYGLDLDEYWRNLPFIGVVG